MRLDQWLVFHNWAPSRAKAQELIRQGSVEVFEGEMGWQVVDKVSHKLSPEFSTDHIRLKSQDLLRFVSRGGLKLEAALRHLGVEPKGWTALDVGQSTGGFSDCLLQAGALKVVGVDVGQGQLEEALQKDTRVSHFEQLHVKDLKSHKDFLSHCPPQGFDLVVMDLSFISLTKALPEIRPFMSPSNGRLLALVKPQFEVGREALTKKGMVKDDGLYEVVRVKIIQVAEALNLQVLDYFPSALPGTEGNQEFFIYAQTT